ncbi:MAG: hypothetical protein KKC99_03125, partial [Proteobacteria bacterium]|nr:hypothetical protein [Pseudomonadota bacterium]
LLASADSVSAKVSMRQLIEREIDFDIVAISGLDLHVVRLADGSTNVDSLLKLVDTPSGSESLEWEGFDLSTLTVRGLRLEDSILRFTDEQSGTEIRAEKVRFRTNDYQSDAPMDFALDAEIDWPQKEIEATVGWMGSLLMAADFSWVQVPESSFQLSIVEPTFFNTNAPSLLTTSATLDSREGSVSLQGFKIKVPELLLTGDVQVENILASPRATGHLAASQFMVADALNHYFEGLIPDKDPGIFQDGSFSLDFSLDENALSITNLDAACDKTHLQGSVTATDFSKPHYSFDLSGSSLDFDRYYRIFIVDEPFILADFGPEFLSTVQSSGRVQLNDVILGGGNFKDFSLSAETGEGTSLVTLEKGSLWDGAATGQLRCSIHQNEQGGYPLTLSGSFAVKNADTGQLPLLGGEDRSFSGRGGVRVAFDMPETLFQTDTIIDAVLHHTSSEVAYVLGKGALLRKEHAPLVFDAANATVKITATGKPPAEGGYAYKTGIALTVRSDTKPYALEGRLNGAVQVAEDFSSLKLSSAKTGLQLSGSPLPPGESTVLVSAVVNLDTRKQTLVARELSLEGNAGTVRGELVGNRILEQDFTYIGPLSIDSDARLVFGLMDVEIGETRDDKVLSYFGGTLDLALTANQAILSNLDLTFDDTHGTGKVRIEDFETGYATFQLGIDSLDINRYRPPRPKRLPDKCNFPVLDAVRLPLNTLSAANIDGDIQAGDFRIFDISFKNLIGHVTMKDGQINLPNLHSDFYGGQMNGNYSGTATRENLSSHMQLRAENFRGAPFMVDVSGKEYVDGTSTVYFDMKTTAATDDEFIADMSGRAGVTILDGSYKFSGKSEPPPGEKPLPAERTSRTGFDGAAALFRIAKGRFMTDDFKMDASFLTAKGAGNFDLALDTIDFTLEAEYSVVPTVIPIHIHSCLHDPGVSIPGMEILGNTVKELIGLPLRPFTFLRDLLF